MYYSFKLLLFYIGMIVSAIICLGTFIFLTVFLGWASYTGFEEGGLGWWGFISSFFALLLSGIPVKIFKHRVWMLSILSYFWVVYFLLVFSLNPGMGIMAFLIFLLGLFLTGYISWAISFVTPIILKNKESFTKRVEERMEIWRQARAQEKIARTSPLVRWFFSIGYLFFGIPCLIAGLYSTLPYEYQGVLKYTVSFLSLMVGSVGLWYCFKKKGHFSWWDFRTGFFIILLIYGLYYFLLGILKIPLPFIS